MKFSDIKLEKGEALVLRTAKADGTSHNGFKWPKTGPVECSGWDKTPECGHGLHGLLDGDGDYGLLATEPDALWQILKVRRKDCVEIDHKVKFPRCEVLLTTDMPGAMAVLIDYWMMRMPKKNNAKAGKLAASGDYSRLAASGDYSQLAASGDSSRLAASGDSSQLAASGHSSQLAASGHSSKLAASGYYSQLAASGKKSIAIAAGRYSTVSAAEDGCIALSWWDEKAQRFRLTVGYVGEGDIKPNTIYRLNAAGEFEEVK